MENQKVPSLKVYVIAHGLKKRCRKPSREMIKLGTRKMPEPIEMESAIKALTAKALDSIKDTMKSTVKATLHIDYVEIEAMNGAVIESWRMFDERHKTVMLFDNTLGMAVTA